jgi:hypothetical protein
MNTLLFLLAVGGVLVVVGAIFLYRRGALSIDRERAAQGVKDFAGDTKEDLSKWKAGLEKKKDQ